MAKDLLTMVEDHARRLPPIEELLKAHDLELKDILISQERCSTQHRRWGEQMSATLQTQATSNKTNERILAALENQALFNLEQGEFNKKQVEANMQQCVINREQNAINAEQLKYTKIIADATTAAKANWTMFKWFVAFCGGLVVIASASALLKAILEWLGWI